MKKSLLHAGQQTAMFPFAAKGTQIKTYFKNLDRSVISWALYDWANSAFATTVMAGFFPLFFKKYWSQGASVTESTYHLGIGNSLAGLFIALTGPVLGAFADQGSAKKKFLVSFAALGMVTTGSLCFVHSGQWQVAVLLYVLASIGFTGSNIFYDSLLLIVSPKDKLDFNSAFGFGLGYLGGGLLFAVNVLMFLKPHLFGIADGSTAVRYSFMSVGIWWAIFTIPLMLFVHEEDGKASRPVGQIIKLGFRQFLQTFNKLRRYKMLFTFLIGYMFYIDGINTIIKMAVDYGMALGFGSESLIVALLVVQFVGFPAAIAFGLLGQKIGAKAGILIALYVYVGVTIFGYFMNKTSEFYIMAVCIGLVQGGVQALSRSLFGSLIPDKNQSGEFFGFFNMLGKFSSILGPFLVGWVSVTTNNPRASILVILVFLAIGMAILTRVKPQSTSN